MKFDWYVRGAVVLFCIFAIAYSVVELSPANIAYLPIVGVVFTLLFDICRTIEKESSYELTVGNLGKILKEDCKH